MLTQGALLDRNLADTQDRGALDQTDFIIGMYLINGVKSGLIPAVPTVLPAGVYEAASEGRLSSGSGSNLRSMTTSPQPISRQGTGNAVIPRQLTGGNIMAPVQRHFTGQPPTSPIARNVTGGQFQQPATHQMLPNVTGGSFKQQPNYSSPVPPSQTYSAPVRGASGLGVSAFGSPPPPAQQKQANIPWDVSAAEKSAADGFFNQLDKFGRGVLEGDVAVPFMLESKLPEMTLASIWYVFISLYRLNAGSVLISPSQGPRRHQEGGQPHQGRVRRRDVPHQGQHLRQASS